MAVEYEISSDVATIKDVAPNTQVASIVKFYNGSITYDDEPTSKYASVTINGKTQRVMLCVAVSGTVNYDDVPCLYSTVDGHRTLNVVEPTETGTPDDVPSLYETVVVDGKTVRALRCVLINATPNYDGVSSTCTFTDNGKTHTAQLVNQIGAGAIEEIVKGVPPLSLPDAIANSLQYVKAFGGTELSGTPTPDAPATITCNNGILKVKDSELPVGYKRLTGITYDSDTYYETNEKLYGSDTLTIRLSNTKTAGQNVIGAYSGTGDDARNFSLYIYGNGATNNSYLRHGTKLGRPRYGTGTRTLVMGPTGTDGFLNDVTYDAEDFETTDTFRIGSLPNSSSPKYDGNIIGNITVSNRLKYIPCERVSDGKIGYYETFTGTFLEPQGTGTPVSMGYEVSYMTEIYADGTVETIEDTIGNSATCEPLLAVGDYTDVQSILDGVITRKVGVKVLTGDENFETATATNCYSLTNTLGTGNFADRTIMCSHFDSTSTQPGTGDRQGLAFIVNKGPEYTIAFGATTQFSTQTQWKNWLAAQAAAGTPVIIVYPIRTPTTEVVAGQTLQVTQGDNTLEITQASLTGLELEAKYMKGVVASVEEVDSQGLDNNVSVSLS